MFNHSENDVKGEVLKLVGHTLIGWAKESYWIEILADNFVMGIVQANFDLSNQFETLTAQQSKNGFIFSIDAHQLLTIKKLEARIANTNQKLNGFICPHTKEFESKTLLLGTVENHGSLKCWGWVWNPALPEQTQSVIFSYKGNELAKIDADIYNDELAEKQIDNSYHGFEWTLPIFFADGKIHQIDVLDSLGNTLAGSPLQVFIPQQGYTNWVEQLSLFDSEKRLLKKLTERYQQYVPLSFDFSSYSEWSKVFGKVSNITNVDQNITVIIFGETGNLNVTLQSLYAQTHSNWNAFVYGRWTDLLYHNDERVCSISPENWHKTLSDVFVKNGVVTKIKAGDFVEPHAFKMIINAMQDDSVSVLYSDCDVPDENGRMPWFKPDWDIDLFLHTTALDDLFTTRGHYLKNMTDEQLRCEPFWATNVLIQLNENIEIIKHLTGVFYHRASKEKIYGDFSHSSFWLTVNAPKTSINKNRIDWGLPRVLPKISLIIPTRDRIELLKNCISTLKQTNYPNLEWIVIDNDSTEFETLNYLNMLEKEGINVIQYAGTFNFSAMNNYAVKKASGDLIVLLNNDVELIHADWLQIMVSELLRSNVGAVGAKLLWKNGMVQHGGVLMGLHGLAGHIGNHWHDLDEGYFGINQYVREVSAVTAACLLCRRDDYLKLNGLNELDLAVNFNDVDFCLRLKTELGKRIIWTPHAKLYHLESASRGKELLPEQRARTQREIRYMLKTWQQQLTHDSCYNPNLNLDKYSHAGLAFPPR